MTYSVHAYNYDPGADRIGVQAAESLGASPGLVLKTLMALVDAKPVCVIVPSDKVVNMKQLAAACGGRSAQMMRPQEAERLTGYHVGGISPFGQKKQLPTVIDPSFVLQLGLECPEPLFFGRGLRNTPGRGPRGPEPGEEGERPVLVESDNSEIIMAFADQIGAIPLRRAHKNSRKRAIYLENVGQYPLFVSSIASHSSPDRNRLDGGPNQEQDGLELHTERPMGSLERQERRLAAIFAADVAGYSRLMSQDEVGTLCTLTAHRAILDRFIGEHGGRIANTAGDSVLAELTSVVDAVQCAVTAQEAFAAADQTGVALIARQPADVDLQLGSVPDRQVKNDVDRHSPDR